MKQLDKNLNKAYETDASMIIGNPEKVIIPESLNELQETARQNAKICIRGAGTGLVGGCVPQCETLVDMSKFNKISNFNRIRKTIEVEAGVVLDDLNAFLDDYELEFPVQPSSHAVCTIGGMIATNAVGSRAIKHGRTSNWIEWLEIIDGDGKIQKKFKSEISDFSGLEGISGIVYKACLKLEDKKYRTASLIKKDSIDKLIEEVRLYKRNANVSMIEFFDKSVSKMLNLTADYHILIEFESDEGQLKGKKYEEIISLRDKIYPLLAREGYNLIEDPKVFLDKINDLIFFLETNKIPVFGHISVGILHPCFSELNKSKIPEMMKIVKRLNGQVSGEHGIGLLKKQFLEEQDKNIIKIIKKRTDPKNKFNNGKVI